MKANTDRMNIWLPYIIAIAVLHFGISSGQTYFEGDVPMIPCSIGETDYYGCYYQGEYQPNGTLGVGETMYFTIDLSDQEFPTTAGKIVDVYLPL